MQNRVDRRVGACESGSFVRARVAILALTLLVNAFGCASGRVSNLEAYGEIPMNQVIPYPSQGELRKRAYKIVVVDRPSAGIDEKRLEKPRTQVHRALEAILTQVGATVIDRSLQEIGGGRTEGILGELEGRLPESVSGADYALAIHFSNYRYTSKWKKPFKFLWQSPEEAASKPGTCTHETEVEVDIQLVEIGSTDRVAKTFALEHTAEQENKDLDPVCTIAPVTLGVLFEKALDEAVSCLRAPLGRLLAPRGHLIGHRKAADADRHVYQISLGSVQGIESGDLVEILREQRSMSPSGDESRSERVIVEGRVTDQVMAQASWVAADPAKATDALLKGDVIRPVFAEGLLSSLSGPDCEDILDER